MNDTEVKLIFNLIENHWHLGDKFVIRMESVLNSCSSCQRYLPAVEAWAAKHGKTIKFEFLAHPGAVDIPKAYDIIN